MNITIRITIRQSFAFALLASSMMLGGCEMYAPSNLNETRIQVAEEGISRDMPVSEATDDVLASLAQDFDDRGGSPMDVVVTYDPKSYRNTAMIAGDEAARIARSLRKYGSENINSSILPVKDQGDESRVMVSYHAVAALAPDGCTDMPGINGNLLEPDPNYKLGCGVDTMIAKQVSRPSDLLGRGSSDPATDGRGAANVIEAYRTGAKNEPLQGESSSGKE